MKLGNQLRNLRYNAHVTQESLAQYLGVTPQAVSKWERDEGMPDITLLPGIASFYQVSTDVILGIEESKYRNAIDGYKAQDKQLTEQGRAGAREELWRNACKAFPNDTEVLHYTCFALRASDVRKNADEIIKLSNEILARSKVSGEYFAAIGNICRAYAAKGDIAAAKEYAAMAGRYVGTENQLMIRILNGEEAAGYC